MARAHNITKPAWDRTLVQVRRELHVYTGEKICSASTSQRLKSWQIGKSGMRSGCLTNGAIPMFLGHAVLKEAILGVYQYLGERSDLNSLDQPKANLFS